MTGNMESTNVGAEVGTENRETCVAEDTCVGNTCAFMAGDKILTAGDSIPPEGRAKPLKISGYLEKRSKFVWKRFWFVLDGRLLTYYKSKADYDGLSACCGSINLGIATNVSPMKSTKGCTFQIVTRTQIYYLRAPIKRELDKWLLAVQEAVALPANISLPVWSDPGIQFYRYSFTNLSQWELSVPKIPQNFYRPTSILKKCHSFTALNFSGKSGLKHSVSKDNLDHLWDSYATYNSTINYDGGKIKEMQETLPRGRPGKLVQATSMITLESPSPHTVELRKELSRKLSFQATARKGSLGAAEERSAFTNYQLTDTQHEYDEISDISNSIYEPCGDVETRSTGGESIYENVDKSPRSSRMSFGDPWERLSQNGSTHKPLLPTMSEIKRSSRGSGRNSLVSIAEIPEKETMPSPNSPVTEVSYERVENLQCDVSEQASDCSDIGAEKKMKRKNRLISRSNSISTFFHKIFNKNDKRKKDKQRPMIITGPVDLRSSRTLLRMDSQEEEQLGGSQRVKPHHRPGLQPAVGFTSDQSNQDLMHELNQKIDRMRKTSRLDSSESSATGETRTPVRPESFSSTRPEKPSTARTWEVAVETPGGLSTDGSSEEYMKKLDMFNRLSASLSPSFNIHAQDDQRVIESARIGRSHSCRVKSPETPPILPPKRRELPHAPLYDVPQNNAPISRACDDKSKPVIILSSSLRDMTKKYSLPDVPVAKSLESSSAPEFPLLTDHSSVLPSSRESSTSNIKPNAPRPPPRPPKKHTSLPFIIDAENTQKLSNSTCMTVPGLNPSNSYVNVIPLEEHVSIRQSEPEAQRDTKFRAEGSQDNNKTCCSSIEAISSKTSTGDNEVPTKLLSELNSPKLVEFNFPVNEPNKAMDCGTATDNSALSASTELELLTASIHSEVILKNSHASSTPAEHVIDEEVLAPTPIHLEIQELVNCKLGDTGETSTSDRGIRINDVSEAITKPCPDSNMAVILEAAENVEYIRRESYGEDLRREVVDGDWAKEYANVEVKRVEVDSHELVETVKHKEVPAREGSTTAHKEIFPPESADIALKGDNFTPEYTEVIENVEIVTPKSTVIDDHTNNVGPTEHNNLVKNLCQQSTEAIKSVKNVSLNPTEEAENIYHCSAEEAEKIYDSTKVAENLTNIFAKVVQNFENMVPESTITLKIVENITSPPTQAIMSNNSNLFKPTEINESTCTLIRPIETCVKKGDSCTSRFESEQNDTKLITGPGEKTRTDFDATLRASGNSNRDADDNGGDDTVLERDRKENVGPPYCENVTRVEESSVGEQKLVDAELTKDFKKFGFPPSPPLSHKSADIDSLEILSEISTNPPSEPNSTPTSPLRKSVETLSEPTASHQSCTHQLKCEQLFPTQSVPAVAVTTTTFSCDPIFVIQEVPEADDLEDSSHHYDDVPFETSQELKLNYATTNHDSRLWETVEETEEEAYELYDDFPVDNFNVAPRSAIEMDTSSAAVSKEFLRQSGINQLQEFLAEETFSTKTTDQPWATHTSPAVNRLGHSSAVSQLKQMISDS